MWSSLFKKAHEEKSLPTLDATEINKKLEDISALHPNGYYQRFEDAFNAYMGNTKAITKAVVNYGYKHTYRSEFETRHLSNAMKSNRDELLEFLNRSGGTDKKSLKFHVLIKMFDLDSDDYSDETAKKLVDDTHNLLQYHCKLQQIEACKNSL
ncbi:MAG TPA: hypothetical protein VLI69_00160 [Gammaproteobacteria bacterium]|nr:hypothetical protein [Gammaproteobacteria bacterium]